MLAYTPVAAGFASLPTTLGVLISAGAASALVPRIGPKPLMVLGGLLAAAGLFLMSFLDIDSGFWELAFPGQLLLGLGLGFTFVPLSNLALVGAGEHDAGAASAMLERDPAGRRLDRHGPAGHAVGGRDHATTSPTRSPPGRTRRTPPSVWRHRSRATRRRSPGPSVLLVARRARLRGAHQGDEGRPAGRRRWSTPADLDDDQVA